MTNSGGILNLAATLFEKLSLFTKNKFISFTYYNTFTPKSLNSLRTVDVELTFHDQARSAIWDLISSESLGAETWCATTSHAALYTRFKTSVNIHHWLHIMSTQPITLLIWLVTKQTLILTTHHSMLSPRTPRLRALPSHAICLLWLQVFSPNTHYALIRQTFIPLFLSLSLSLPLSLSPC